MQINTYVVMAAAACPGCHHKIVLAGDLWHHLWQEEACMCMCDSLMFNPSRRDFLHRLENILMEVKMGDYSNLTKLVHRMKISNYGGEIWTKWKEGPALLNSGDQFQLEFNHDLTVKRWRKRL